MGKKKSSNKSYCCTSVKLGQDKSLKTKHYTPLTLHSPWRSRGNALQVPCWSLHSAPGIQQWNIVSTHDCHSGRLHQSHGSLNRDQGSISTGAPGYRYCFVEHQMIESSKKSVSTSSWIGADLSARFSCEFWLELLQKNFHSNSNGWMDCWGLRCLWTYTESRQAEKGVLCHFPDKI